MAAMDTPLQSAPMATMATILMPALLMGITARHGSMAASLSAPVPGIVATVTAIAGITVIAAGTTDGLFTVAGTAAAMRAAGTEVDMLVAGTVAALRAADTAGAQVPHIAVAAGAVDSTVAAAVTAVVDTGNFLRQ